MRHALMGLSAVILLFASTGCNWTNGNLRNGCVNGLCNAEKADGGRGGFVGGHRRRAGCPDGNCGLAGRGRSAVGRVLGRDGAGLAGAAGNGAAGNGAAGHDGLAHGELGHGGLAHGGLGHDGLAHGHGAHGLGHGHLHGGGTGHPQGHPHGYPHGHHGGQMMAPSGPPVGAYAYPYYTTRGPRDFLIDNPPSIGR